MRRSRPEHLPVTVAEAIAPVTQAATQAAHPMRRAGDVAATAVAGSRPRTRLALAGGAAVALTAGGTAWLISRRRHRSTLPGQTRILSPRKSTSIAHDGAVRSVQSAELTVSKDEFERLWTRANLENLARTYWRFLTTVTFGLVRVRYDDSSRSVVLLTRPLTLLRFDLPDYEFEPGRGKVTWRIRDGLLVTRAGRESGLLSLDVRELERPGAPNRVTMRIEVEVSNFYPSIATSFSTPVYEMTQSFIHVLVTHGFLRSLASLELVRSEVGRFSLPMPEHVAGDPATSDQP